MRTVYISPGKAKSERLKILTEKLIQERDGFHPVPPEAIWYDDERRGEPIMVIWNNIICPQGTKSPAIREKMIRQECEIIKRARQKPPVSMRWSRTLTAILDGVMTYGIFLVVLAILAGGALSAFLG
jgi:hypothetical protein